MYRTIDTSFWDDPKIRRLGLATKMLALYLFSNSQAHVTGVYVFHKILAADHLCIDLKTVEKSFQELCRCGFCIWDEERRVVWVKNMWKRQPHAGVHLDRLPIYFKTLNGSPLVAQFFKQYCNDKKLALACHHFVTNLHESALQEQEIEQEQEQEYPPIPPPTEPGGGVRRKLPLLKSVKTLTQALAGVDIQPMRDVFQPRGFDVDACWEAFCSYVLKGNASKTFPNPSNWRDFPLAFRESCDRALRQGRFLLPKPDPLEGLK
ncbi:MAG: hypothetical protein WC654_04335 [Patescibacteria group bacterium]